MDINLFIDQKYSKYLQDLAEKLQANSSLNIILSCNSSYVLNKAKDFLIAQEFTEQTEPPDLHILKAVNQTISIEAARTLKNRLTRKPAIHKRHCLIIDALENLTIPAANALLKALEEPAGDCLAIMLSARPEQIMATILSRSFHFRLPEIHPKEILSIVNDNIIHAVSLSLFPEKEIAKPKLLELWFKGQFSDELAEVYNEREQIQMLLSMLDFNRKNNWHLVYCELIKAMQDISRVGANAALIASAARYTWQKYQRS